MELLLAYLDAALADFAWYRKRRGGDWELIESVPEPTVWGEPCGEWVRHP